jgi:cellulose synthase/poly-beta-1,6-N-acetylglucosamine synthase-like glycosyltransferase
VPYQSGSSRRNNVQLGVGRSVWGGAPPPPISEQVLDGIPGCLAWIALLFCIAGAIAFPRLILLIAALLAFYSATRFVFAGIANVIGLRYIRQWEQCDWHARYLQEAPPGSLNWDDVHHILIIPNYKEPVEVLRKTLTNMAQQYEARKRITIVLAMEAGEDGYAAKAETLRDEFGNQFAHFYYTAHPRGLPGEMQGKSANAAWAGRWIKRKLVDELKYDINCLTISTSDADTIWHRHYFFALTYLFAVDPQRYTRFWQAPIRYHDNIWEINPMMRLIHVYSTAFELAYLAAPWWIPLPMSSYSLSMRLLDISGYWDADVIADEWHMFIKAFFARDGTVEVTPIFLPFLSRATSGKNLLDEMRNRYQQTLRHAWGSKEVGYMVAKMLEHPELPIRPTARLLFRVAHDILLAGTGWIIMTVGSQLPLLLNPSVFSQMLAAGISDPIFLILQVSFFLVSILGIFFWYLDLRVRPPRPSPPGWSERIMTLISFPLLAILTLIFVAIPTLQAQTRLLVGIPLNFRVTPKT